VISSCEPSFVTCERGKKVV